MSVTKRDGVKGPLSGYRIVEFGIIFTLPLASMWLADQGADVIKVEAPSGDLVRYSYSTRMGADNLSSGFLNVNRNKRSIVLDMKQPAALEIVRNLIKDADVVMQNFRPGVMERLGLGYDDVKKIKKDIVYVSVSGFGTEGPYAKQRVFDPLIQAVSGITSAQRETDNSIPEVVKMPIVDLLTAQVIFQSVTAALLERANSGEGQLVEVNMLSAALSVLWPDLMSKNTFVGDDVTPGGSMRDLRCIYPTKDGHLLTFGASDSDWAGLCNTAGKPELLKDPRFADIQTRGKNSKDIYEALKDCFKSKTTEEWLTLMREHDVVCAPVNTTENIHLDPQIQALGLVVESDHPQAGTYRQPIHPIRFEKTPADIRRHAPLLGEQTDEILREMGLSESELAQLHADGVVK